MEGKQGTIIDMGAKPAPVITPNLEGEVSVRIGQSGSIKQSFESPDAESRTTHPEEGRVKDYPARTTKPLDTGVQPADQSPTSEKEQKEDSEKTPEELIAEKRMQLIDHIEKLGEHLTKEEKEQLLKDYLADYLTEGKDQDEGKKFEDTFAELARLIMLIFTLLMMLITSDKVNFSGKDLNLPEDPPEGEAGNMLTKLISGKDSKESWMAFRKEIADIKEEVPFGKFMSLVLTANERNSVKHYKQIKGNENKNGVITKNNKPGLFGRILGLAKRKPPVRGRS